MRKLTTTLLAAVAMAGLGATGAVAQDIIIASAGPMTGQYASFGEQMRRGAELAVKDINAKGGVLGRQLKLEIGDDACDPKQAVAVANQLATKKAVFVAGHFCSSSSIPASAVYAEAGILQITPASTNPALTEDAAKKGWTHVFRTSGRDDAQGLVAGKFLATKYKGGKVAIIHDKSTYGKGLADETKKAMNAAGLQEAMYEAVTQGDKDFTALVSKMKAANIQAIYVGGYHTEAGLIVRQAREQGFNAQLISGDALVTDEFWKISGKAGEGTLMTFEPDPREFTAPAAKALVQRFRDQKYDPEGYTLYSYAAVQLWADAATKAKSLKPADIGKVIKTGKHETVLGSLTYDAKGDRVNPEYVWFVWKDGKYSQIKGAM
jgi:branched-chain amino acid transport system substrate-binding protein